MTNTKIVVRIALLVVALTAPFDGDARAAALTPAAHRYFGWLGHAQANRITLRLRTGRLLLLDATPAFAAGRVAEPLFAGKPACVDGFLAAGGVFRAVEIQRAVAQPAAWGRDR